MAKSNNNNSNNCPLNMRNQQKKCQESLMFKWCKKMLNEMKRKQQREQNKALKHKKLSKHFESNKTQTQY